MLFTVTGTVQRLSAEQPTELPHDYDRERLTQALEWITKEKVTVTLRCGYAVASVKNNAITHEGVGFSEAQALILLGRQFGLAPDGWDSAFANIS